MQKKDAKIWKFVAAKVKGGFGETDFDKKVVKIDKAKHKDKKKYAISKEDSTLQNTILHETLHTQHPNMTEEQVRKQTRNKLKKASRKFKNKLLNKIK